MAAKSCCVDCRLSYKADFQLSAKTPCYLFERCHGGVAVAILKPTEVRCLHPAALGELLLSEAFFHSRFHDLTHYVVLYGLLVPFLGESFVLDASCRGGRRSDLLDA